MEIFELLETTPEQVVIKVNAKDALTVARHPYIQANYEYITVTRGKEHILTIVHDTGTTFSFHWGDSGYTLISDSLEKLKRKVLEFISKHDVLMECNFDKADKADLFYNIYHKAWQLSLYKGSQNGYHWFYDLSENNETSRLKAIEKAKKFGVCDFVRGTCATGIPIWNSHSNC